MPPWRQLLLESRPQILITLFQSLKQHFAFYYLLSPSFSGNYFFVDGMTAYFPVIVPLWLFKKDKQATEKQNVNLNFLRNILFFTVLSLKRKIWNLINCKWLWQHKMENMYTSGTFKKSIYLLFWKKLFFLFAQKVSFHITI